MTEDEGFSRYKRWSAAVFAAGGVCVYGSVASRGSECLGEKAERRYFNVPKGEGIKSLKIAAKQAKVEFLLSTDMLKGVETKKIRGRPSQDARLGLGRAHVHPGF